MDLTLDTGQRALLGRLLLFKIVINDAETAGVLI